MSMSLIDTHPWLTLTIVPYYYDIQYITVLISMSMSLIDTHPWLTLIIVPYYYNIQYITVLISMSMSLIDTWLLLWFSVFWVEWGEGLSMSVSLFIYLLSICLLYSLVCLLIYWWSSCTDNVLLESVYWS